MSARVPDWGGLRGSVAGEVVLPGSPAYDSARKPEIANFHDRRPQAVVLCETPRDAAEALLFARRCGLPLVPRSGGHCFAGRSSTGGVVVDVSPMRSVTVSGGVATVGAGARLGGVYDALDAHGLTIPAGCGPTVGISGLTLGGGLGVLGRKRGLTSDSLLAAQVVLADGRIVECDENREPDLFWALRGAGGGNFGVVTSLAFETIPAPDATVFHLAWTHAHAATVIEAWQSWSPPGPDELAASLLAVAPADPSLPPAINVFGTMIGAESDAADLLDELVGRVGADPASTFRKQMAYREVKRYLAGLGDRMAGENDRISDASGERLPAGYSYSKSEFFREPLPEKVIEALVENFAENRTAGQSRELDFTPWGGAYNRVPTHATAFPHRDELFLLHHSSTAGASDAEAARDWLGRSWAAVHPWGTGGVYPNFPDPDLENWARTYHGTNLERLVRVKREYDPDGFFEFHQSLQDLV